LSNGTPKFVGPHEDHELELMKEGTKPLAMFVEPLGPEFDYFPEEEFDALVAKEKIVKHVSLESIVGPDGKEHKVRRVLYALPEEVWRIKAILLIQHIYDTQSPGFRPDLERLIGALLGYNCADVESYIELMSRKKC
jgi:hypothetical protein